MQGQLANNRALTYEGKLFLNWIATGQLPKPMYDMDAGIMLTLFEIQVDVQAMIGDVEAIRNGEQ